MSSFKPRVMMSLMVALSIPVLSVSAEPSLSKANVSRLDQMIDTAEKEHGIVGQSVRVLKNGKLVYARDTGFESLDRTDPVNADTVFPVYSITKLYVATLAAKLRAEGRLDPEATIGTYLDDLPAKWQNLKLRALLSHTSGLPEFFSVRREYSNDPLEVIASLKDRPLSFNVGSQVEYNSTNFMLIKMIIEKLYDDTLEAIINSEFVSPLQLKNTFYKRNTAKKQGRVSSYYISEGEKIVDFGVPVFKPVMYAASGLQTSADDMAAWAEALLSGQHMTQGTLARTWEPQSLTNGLMGDYSNGWQVQREQTVTAVGHYGGNILNFRHFFLNDDPGESVTIIHLTNGWASQSFGLFDFSYALAKVIEPRLFLGSIDLKDDVIMHAKSGNTAGMIKTYEALKRYAAAQRMNTEMLVNALGYQIIDIAPEASAILFKGNLADYPNSANAHDSYAEALYRSGQYALAKEHYQKALALEPTFDHIPALLAEIDKTMQAHEK